MKKSVRNLTTQGIALLMSLSVILVLTIALMKTFESRTVETAHLVNNNQRFQSETLSRSVFRAILIAIKTKGLIYIVKNKSYWEGIPLPLQEQQYCQITDVKPIDHRFNINKRFRNDDPRAEMLVNIVNIYRKTNNSLTEDLLLDEIYPFLSAVNDWIDSDIEQDSVFMFDYEDYAGVEPEFEVKNRGFDRLSEIKALPPFQELGISFNDIKDQFRIFSGDEFIDINLAEEDEIISFLERYKDLDTYPNVYNNSKSLVDIITNRDKEQSEENGGMSGFLDPQPRFSPPLYSRGKSSWEQTLAAEGITLERAEKDLFQAVTNHLFISFSITVENTTVITDAVIKLSYKNSSSTDIKSIEILSYVLR